MTIPGQTLTTLLQTLEETIPIVSDKKKPVWKVTLDPLTAQSALRVLLETVRGCKSVPQLLAVFEAYKAVRLDDAQLEITCAQFSKLLIAVGDILDPGEEPRGVNVGPH
ncbi:MAG: hypothetical protein ACT4QA_04600 [Panacagrimonas sp.]